MTQEIQAVAAAMNIRPDEVVSPEEIMKMTKDAVSTGAVKSPTKATAIRYAKNYMIVYFSALGKDVPEGYEAELNGMEEECAA